MLDRAWLTFSQGWSSTSWLGQGGGDAGSQASGREGLQGRKTLESVGPSPETGHHLLSCRLGRAPGRACRAAPIPAACMLNARPAQGHGLQLSPGAQEALWGGEVMAGPGRV